MRRKIYLLAAFLLLGLIQPLSAQQDPMYSQYLNNAAVLNPAYVGTRGAFSTVLLSRLQWIGVPGAPKTNTVSFHAPTKNDRHGFGVSLVNDMITYFNRSFLNLNYAYRIPVGKNGTFAMGLVGTVHYQRINWTRALTETGSDQSMDAYGNGHILPNAGVGFYYENKLWYAGISMPRILSNAYRGNMTNSNNEILDRGKLERHYFLTAGMVISLTDKIKLKPSTLVKYTYGANVEFDINATLFFIDKIGATVSYRTGDGMVLMLQYNFTKSIWFAYAFDYPFTRLSSFTSGSHEFSLGFDIPRKTKKFFTPRYY